MAARKRSDNKKAHTIDADYISALVAAADKKIAQQPKPYDQRDTPRDRQFAIIMQRVDCLQASRAEYLRVILAMQQQPQLMAGFVCRLQQSLANALRAAQLPAKPWHIGALMTVYMATVVTWRNDTTADLARTMKTCDRALSALEMATNFVRVRAA